MKSLFIQHLYDVQIYILKNLHLWLVLWLMKVKQLKKTHLIKVLTIFTVYNQYLQTWSKTIQSSTLINKKASVLLLQQWFMQSRVPAVVIDSSPDSSSGPLTTYAWTTSRVTLHSMQPNANMYIKSVLSITCQNVIQQWSNASADTYSQSCKPRLVTNGLLLNSSPYIV